MAVVGPMYGQCMTVGWPEAAVSWLRKAGISLRLMPSVRHKSRPLGVARGVFSQEMSSTGLLGLG